MRAWIGLGGNREDSQSLLDTALEAVGESPHTSVLRCSELYRSVPWGVSDQPEFLNAVAELDTALDAHALMEFLLALERRLGRQRGGRKWGPRCIDLDLLTYEELSLKTDELEVPHPSMHLRAFVLIPLIELEPGFRIPGVGSARQCLAKLDREERLGVRALGHWNREHGT
jgi:2-amino-4-hydroxy-6-hydroxymethyldihydropteridine diphosphokinase